MTVQEVAAAARAEGLSYGQYVDRHRGDPAVSAPPDKPLVRRCAVCGARFWVRTQKNRRVYCSAACSDVARRQKQAGLREPRTGTCARCGKVFAVSKYAPNQQYCTAVCRRAAAETRRREGRRSHDAQ